MPFVEGDSTQVARPIRPVSQTSVVADLDRRQRQDDRALIPRTATRVASLTGERGQVTLGDVDPGDTVTTTWEVPGRSGPVTVLLTLYIKTDSHTGTAVLVVENAGWTITFAPSAASRATTAMFTATAGDSVSISVSTGIASTGPVAASLTYSTIG